MDTIRQSMADITSSESGFGVNMVLTAPAPSSESATIKGLHSKHFLAIGTDGLPVNSKNPHITFSERILMASNPLYPLRDASGEINLKKHKVTVADSTEQDKNYYIQQWFPNESTGIIVCLLSDRL